MSVDPFSVSPEEAIAFFTAKGYKIGWSWLETQKEEHSKAFTVAKAMQLDLLEDIRRAVGDAVKDGQTVRTFAKGLTPLLVARGWWGEKEQLNPHTGKLETVQLGSPRRLRTIFETNLRTSRSAGQWDRIQRTKAARPYLRYVAHPDARPEHRAWNNTVLPVDDPWWGTHMPPNGWGCRCKVQQLNDSDVRRYGFHVASQAPTRPGDETGIGAGWAYNPGERSGASASL